MDFENYVKANDAVLKNVQNQASTSNSGTLPSQTVTNPRQQINAITTRSGKTLEEPSIPLVPTPDISIPSKEPEQNPETSTEKVQNPNLREYRHMSSTSGGRKNTINQVLNLAVLKLFKNSVSEIGLKDALGRNGQSLTNCARRARSWSEYFLIPCALQELNRTSALADSGASINLLPHSIYKKLELEALTPTRMTLELANPMGIAEDVVVRVDGFTFLADFVVVNFEPDPRVPIILGRPFLRTAKALIDLYEEKLTLRVGKDELVYYADKSEKNKEKNFVHAISIIDFSKDDPFSGSTTNTLPPSSSPMRLDLHEVNFQIYSNPLFEFDDNFKSSNVNPLFEENDKDIEIKSSSSFTLTSPEEVLFEAYLGKRF
ncbi:reverse transcriptase domain-containing protein [Tanacetum coccineum]